MNYVRTLKEVTRADRETCGERAVDLAVLDSKGYDVPLGFVLTNDAFEAFITHNRLQERIGDALASSRAYDLVRELCINGAIPKEVVAEIVESYESLDADATASLNDLMRSADAPFVTLILSPNHAVPSEQNEGVILNVRGLEELLLAIKECWACLFAPRLQRHRDAAGIGNRNLNVGVIVQQMPRCAVTAEAWSATGSNTEEITVKAYLGFPDIGGELGKDEWRVTRDYLKPIYQSVENQTVMLARDEEERLGKAPLGLRGEEQKLTDRVAIELGRLAKKASIILDKHVKLFCNVEEERIQTLIVNPLLLTHGSVKLEGYRAEERIDEPITVTETEEAAVSVDEETGEEEVLAQSHETVVEPTPEHAPVAEPDEHSEVDAEELIVEAEQEAVRPPAYEVAAPDYEEPVSEASPAETYEEEAPDETYEETPAYEAVETETYEETPASPEAGQEYEEPPEAPAYQEPEESPADDEPEESIFANVDAVATAPEPGGAEPDEPVDYRTEEYEETVETYEAPAADAVETDDEARVEAPDETDEEPPAAETSDERPERSLMDAYEEVADALRRRYEARFRNHPPRDMRSVFAELSEEVIIPHEKLIQRLVRIYEEEAEYDQEDEERILAVIDDFLDGFR